jgi:hypothetical protein
MKVPTKNKTGLFGKQCTMFGELLQKRRQHLIRHHEFVNDRNRHGRACPITRSRILSQIALPPTVEAEPVRRGGRRVS